MTAPSLGVVVGVDGSAPSRVALNWAARMAIERGLPITIVYAVSHRMNPVRNRLMVFGVRELPHRQVARVIDDAVDIVAARVGPGQLPQVSTRVVAADPLDTLAQFSAAAELVVVGARRRPPWRAVRSSLGSRLVPLSRCPVAIVRDSNPSMPHPAHAPAHVRMTGWTRPS